jgi:hypothetical protein
MKAILSYEPVSASIVLTPARLVKAQRRIQAMLREVLTRQVDS